MFERSMNAGNFDRGKLIDRSLRAVTDILPLAAYSIKKPGGIDVYWQEYPVDIVAADTVLLYAKASGKFLDGSIAEDPKVDAYITEARQAGKKTGIYHFLRPNNIKAQADTFIKVWDRLGGTDGRPVIDAEIDPAQAGVSPTQWTDDIATFLYYVAVGTGYDSIIYSSIFFWDFTTLPDWATDYDCWPAWYPYYPDNFSTIPSNYILPKFRRWAMWQYSQDGRDQGYAANDYNLLADWFLEELGIGNKTTEYFLNNTVKVVHGREDNNSKPYDYHIIDFHRADIVETITTPGPIIEKDLTENFAQKFGCHVAINMDEVITGTLNPKGWGVSMGHIYKPDTMETGVMIDKNNQFLGMSWNLMPGAYNVACGSNILVIGGVVPASVRLIDLYERSLTKIKSVFGLDNISADPRTVLAWNDKSVLVFMVDGRLQPGEDGATRLDIARFIADYGAKHPADGLINAHNLDGGGSSRAVVDNKIVNKPCKNRYVINHIGWILNIGGSTMPLKYTCTVVNDTKERTTPSIYGKETIVIFRVGETFDTDVIRTVTEYVGSLGKDVTADWAQTPSGNWTAVEFNGKQYLDVTENNPSQPGDLPIIHISASADGYPNLDIDWTPNGPTIN